MVGFESVREALSTFTDSYHYKVMGDKKIILNCSILFHANIFEIIYKLCFGEQPLGVCSSKRNFFTRITTRYLLKAVSGSYLQAPISVLALKEICCSRNQKIYASSSILEAVGSEKNSHQ